MNNNKEEAVLVVANYRFCDANQFCNELNSSKSFKSSNSDFQKVKIKTDIPLPENFPIPFAMYKTETMQIRYSAQDARLDILSFDYAKDKDRLKNLLKTLAQFKLQEITAIGVNFNADCKTKNRLSVLNKKISNETIKNWSKNTGFNLTIPIELDDYDNCCATYFIGKDDKARSEEEKAIAPYLYNISVNYNFKIDEDKADTIQRFNKLENIVKSIENLYKDFQEKCKEIIALWLKNKIILL